jgi:hypothetical protein
MNIDRATEMRRLARVLHKDESDLGYLDSLDGTDLQKLRNLIQNSLIDEFSPLFSKIARAGKYGPDSLSAFLAQKVFGPTLTANISYYTPTDKAVRMAKLFEHDFLTDVAREQVPERAQNMLKAIPLDVMSVVTSNLLANRDYPIMGNFTDYLPEEKAAALMSEIRDPADHLRVSSFAQHKDRVARLVTGLDDDGIKELIVVAFSHDDFLFETSLVTAAMPAEDQQRMARLTDEVNPELRSRARELADSVEITGQLEAYFAA